MYGSYRILHEGLISPLEVLEDLTGGFAEHITWNSGNQPFDLERKLVAIKNKALLLCGIYVSVHAIDYPQ